MTKLTVTSASECGSRDVIEVVADGPRGGKWAFAVHYHRTGKVAHGYRDKPNETYLSPEEIPEVVRQAADACRRGSE